MTCLWGSIAAAAATTRGLTNWFGCWLNGTVWLIMIVLSSHLHLESHFIRRLFPKWNFQRFHSLMLRCCWWGLMKYDSFLLWILPESIRFWLDLISFSSVVSSPSSPQQLEILFPQSNTMNGPRELLARVVDDDDTERKRDIDDPQPTRHVIPIQYSIAKETTPPPRILQEREISNRREIHD